MRKFVSRETYVLVSAALLLALSGCTAANAEGREPENTVLAQVIGVDVDGRGVVVTAAGTTGEGTVLTAASGETLEDAFAALPVSGDRYFSLTNVTNVIVGDGVDLTALLDYILSDPDMSYRARVWAGGFAGGLMEDMKESGLDRIQLLEQDVTDTSTVKTALAALVSGGTAVIPAIAVQDGKLETVGTLYYEVS